MSTHPLPHIAPDASGTPTLFVDDRPFWALAGELHNSSASSPAYLEREVWPAIRPLHLNTVLLTLAWEDIEPVEGQYDLSLLGELLAAARREGLRLVLLWFGLWKNGESAYVPRWVKADTARFTRSRYPSGQESETVSPLCKAAVEADAAAFRQVMAYLREKDPEHTVITVQVENEVGILGADRDYSPAANAAFAGPVPAEVLATFDAAGDSWAEAFGTRAGEYFMAYHYVQAVGAIAAAGKAEKALPMFVNAWQDQYPFRPGCYPSGGPVAPMVPLWQALAPAVDFCSPDIYVPYFVKTCERYLVGGNPLFVPETYRNALSASNALYFFSGLPGMGLSPFGIEDMTKADKEDWRYLAESYRLLAGVQPAALAARAEGKLFGFVKRYPGEWGTVMYFPDYDIQLEFSEAGEGKPGSAGMVILAEDGFYMLACNVKFTVVPPLGSVTTVGMNRIEEGEFVDGRWVRGRVLNGDELPRTKIGPMPQWRFVGVNLH